MKDCILVTGANGQIGTELAAALTSAFPESEVIGLDIRRPVGHTPYTFVEADITDRFSLARLFNKYRPSQVYHLAAILSAAGEKVPRQTWDLNMQGLLNVLQLCVETKTAQLFWPSSIAVFGHGSPRLNTPQETVMDPATVYGITKLAGERWCAYYHKHYHLDVRSLRYPGIISWETRPGGGTTDYAVEMYIAALRQGSYTCYLTPGSTLPMIYMEDAIRATLELMTAPAGRITVRSSYNLAGTSFSPQEEAESIRQHRSDFVLEHLSNDPRQAIADSWPESIDDSTAREDWGWAPRYYLDAITTDMMQKLQDHPELISS